MKKYIFPVLFLTGSLFAFSPAYSQNDSAGQQSEEIIIRKKGEFPEKLNIQLEGNKVTINGKKPEDIKGSIEVIRKKSEGNEAESFGYSGRQPSFGHMPPGFSFAPSPANPNNALLGVLTIPGDSVTEGARIEEVEKGTPADSAGFEKGDVITKVDDTPIESSMDLNQAIGEKDPGDVVTITFIRKGKTSSKDVKLGRNDNAGRNFGMNMPFNHFRFYHPFREPGQPPFFNRPPRLQGFMPFNNSPHLGMTVQNREDGKGVTVMQVKPSSAAEAAGFESGDLLIKLDGNDISNIDDVRATLADDRDKSSIEATIVRDGKQKTLTVKLEKEQQKADL